MYEAIGGPLHGDLVRWEDAKRLKKLGLYRAPTLGESVAWGWPAVIVWDA